MNGDSDLLDGVVVADGAPVVMSKYGFRKETVEGKTYLVSLTRDEYIAALSRYKNVSLDEATGIVVAMEQKGPWCAFLSPNNCIPKDGCSECRKVWESGSYFCMCVG